MSNKEGSDRKEREKVNVDKELLLAIEQVKKGNERAFRYMYNKTYPYVYMRSTFMMETEEDAAKLCKQVYFYVYRQLEQLEFGEELYDWLAGMVYTNAVSIWRKQPEFMIPEQILHYVEQVENYQSGRDLDAQMLSCFAYSVPGQYIEQLSNNARIVWKELYVQKSNIRDIAVRHQCEEEKIRRYMTMAWDEMTILYADNQLGEAWAAEIYEDVAAMIREGVFPGFDRISGHKEIQSEFAEDYVVPVYGQDMEYNQIDDETAYSEEEDDRDDDDEDGYEDDEEAEERYSGVYDDEDGYDNEKLESKKKQMMILFLTAGVVVLIMAAILLLKNGLGDSDFEEKEYTRRSTTEQSSEKDSDKKSNKESTQSKETQPQSSEQSSEVMSEENDSKESSEVKTTKKQKETKETTKETTSKETTTEETTTEETTTGETTTEETTTEETTTEETTAETTSSETTSAQEQEVAPAVAEMENE